MYLVALCTTASAPRCSGCCRYGVANVLSTQTNAPWLCATSLTASMSTKRSSGLVGDSSHTIRVCGVIAFSTASTSEASTGLNVKPKRFSTLSKSRNVPPYTSSMYTTWSPGLSSRVSVLSAPIPEEKARQCFAPSRAARHSSSALRVGLPVREYSKPWCLPTPCCANVVAMWMGWTTAPVTGSGPCPTCNARVENPQFTSPPCGEVGPVCGFTSPPCGEVGPVCGFTSPPSGEVGPVCGADPAGWGRSLGNSAPAAVRDELEQVGAGDHCHGLVTFHHQHRLLAAQQRLESVIERRVRADLAQRRVHRRGHRRGNDRRVAVHAVEKCALLQRADHPLPVRLLDHRQLRDAVALHQVDRLADRGGGLDRDQLRHALGVRGAHLADAHRAQPGQVAVLAHPLVAEELGEVVAPGVREEHDDHVVGTARERHLDRRMQRQSR